MAIKPQEKHEAARFPFAQVDALILDPIRFKLPEGGAQYSRSSALRNSLFRYHKKDSASDAKAYMHKAFAKKNWKDVEVFEPMLEDYIKSFGSLSNLHLRSRFNVTFQLNDVSSTVPLILHGQISRIDLTSTGYAIWIFGKDLENWKNEHRFPLLQLLYARAQKVPENEVSVGIYDINAGQHEFCTFTAAELSESEELVVTSLQKHYRIT